MGKMPTLEQALKVLLQLGITGGGGCVARYQHYIVPVLQRFSVGAQYLAHAPACKISHHGVSKPFGRDNPESGFLCARTLAGIGQGAEHKKTPCCR